jgi:hypothetical protein
MTPGNASVNGRIDRLRGHENVFVHVQQNRTFAVVGEELFEFAVHHEAFSVSA